MVHLTVLCGAVATRSPAPPDLRGVLANLAPYGVASAWDGGTGALHFALAALQRDSARDGLLVGDGRIVVCADARLHQRDQLARSLGQSVSGSDLAMIAAAYRKWGRRCVEHLHGSYAIVVADLDKQGLFLATDHAGSRPLAYYHSDGTFAFSTTALALTGFAGVGHELDQSRAAEVLLLGYASDRTFVQGVRTLPPGEAMWVDATGPSRWRWWLPDEPDVVDHGSLQEQGQRLRWHLESAVGSCAEDADEVGAMLSGGLDSTSVAAVAATQLAPQTLPTYTGVPPASWTGRTVKGWIPDERFAVEALAQRIPNIAPTFVETEYGSLYDGHADLWELGAGPARNGMNLLWLYDVYRSANAGGVDVLLTGSSGNYGFSADGPRWLVELFKRGRLLRTLDEARSFGAKFDLPLRRVLRRELARELVAPMRHRRALRRGAGVFEPQLRSSAINPELLETLDLEATLPAVARPHPRGYLRDVRNLFRSAAAQADLWPAVTARFAVELRDPTQDRALVEHALTQPEWYRRHDGVWRAIAREAMRDLLPPEIVDRPTLGAQQPDWLDRMTHRRAELGGEIEAMRAHHMSTELIDVERLALLVDNWPQRDRMAEPAIIEGYQLALGRAIFISRYLRWFEARAARVKNGGPAVIVSALA